MKGIRRLGVRLGNWLTAEQGRRLLQQGPLTTLRERRDHAMLAVLIGCGLRRGELLALRLESLQQREEHWVIADLVGKGGHVRTVPVPAWVKGTIDAWRREAGITHGAVFRAIKANVRPARLIITNRRFEPARAKIRPTWLCSPAHASAPTRSCLPSARAAWERYIARATPV